MSWGSNYQSGSRRGKTNTVINAVIKDWGWRLEEEQARHNTRDESPSSIGCRLAIPGVIVTDHRALESGVWSSPRIVQDNWTTWITDRIKNLHSLSQPPISQANTDQTPKHLWNSHAQYLALKRQFFVWFVTLDNSWSVLMTRICRVGEFSSSSPSTICSTSPSLSARNSSPRPNTDTWDMITEETRKRLKVAAGLLLPCENVSCFHYCQGRVGSSCPSHLFMFIRAS